MSGVPLLPAYVMRCQCGWEELFDIDSDEAAWSLAYLTGWTPLGNTDLCPRCTNAVVRGRPLTLEHLREHYAAAWGGVIAVIVDGVTAGQVEFSLAWAESATLDDDAVRALYEMMGLGERGER